VTSPAHSIKKAPSPLRPWLSLGLTDDGVNQNGIRICRINAPFGVIPLPAIVCYRMSSATREPVYSTFRPLFPT
jgi:hypothetical protein